MGTPGEIVVYTVSLGRYDYLFPVPPQGRATRIRWVLLSDRRPLLRRGWEWRPLPPEVPGGSATERNRYAKFFPHKLFPQADISIYIDANVALKRPPLPEIESFAASGAAIGLGHVQERRTIQEELAFCRGAGRFDAAHVARMNDQVAAYTARGLPETHRLYAGRVIFRDHRHPGLAPAMDLWWREFLAHSRRDQLSLPWVLHETGLPLQAWDWDYRGGRTFFHVARHRPRRPWLRPDVWLEEMRFSSPLIAGLHRRLAPAFRYRDRLQWRRHEARRRASLRGQGR